MNTPRQTGYSLIELMVSMTIGIALIGSAIYVYDQARTTLNVNETLARMQENARWALNVMEPDIRLAGYWGRHTGGNAIDGSASSANPLVVDANGVDGDCATNWSIDVAVSLEASNNVANPGLAGCIALADYLDGTDTLAVRHASGLVVPTASLVDERIYVRTHEAGLGSLFVGTAEPPIVDGQNNALMAHAYYVRPYSIGGGAVVDPASQIVLRPSLRRQGLTLSGGSAALVDQEVIAGIEDLQIQFGIDTGADGSVDRYVNPDNADLVGARILAVRMWLRVRADNPELGFSDTRNYRYADVDFTPSGQNAAYRRLLVSRTVFLRNEAIIEGGT